LKISRVRPGGQFPTAESRKIDPIGGGDLLEGLSLLLRVAGSMFKVAATLLMSLMISLASW